MKILKLKKIKTAKLDLFDQINFENKVNGSWEKFKKITYTFLLNKSISSFLNWPIIKKTMFVNEAHYLHYEYNFLINSEKKYLSILPEDLWGNPESTDLDLSTSGNRIHHTYLIAKYELETNRNINNYKTIFEFGGGYGSFARLIHRLEFNGIYIIFDFDIFNIIQYNYLEKFAYDIFVQPNKPNGNGIYLFHDLNKLNEFLKNIEIDLFIATWSLSESDMDTRNNVNDILINAKHYLVTFQSEFDSINNVEFFSNKLINKNINVKNIEHMGDGQNYIFI